MSIRKKCEDCNGLGEVNDDCPECDGDGWTTCSHCLSEVDCDECDGDGYVSVDCEECDGNGYIEEPEAGEAPTRHIESLPGQMSLLPDTE